MKVVLQTGQVPPPLETGIRTVLTKALVSVTTEAPLLVDMAQETGFPTMTKETPDRVPMKVAMEVGHLEDMVGMVAFKAAKPVVVKEEAVVEKAEEAVITEETVVEKVVEVVVILEQEVVEVGRVVADMADTVTVVVRQEKEPTVEEVEVMVAEMLLAVVMGLEVIVAATPIDNHSSQLLATTPVVPALSRATRPRCVLFP
eukprot:gene10260-12136_t